MEMGKFLVLGSDQQYDQGPSKIWRGIQSYYNFIQLRHSTVEKYGIGQLTKRVHYQDKIALRHKCQYIRIVKEIIVNEVFSWHPL